VPVQEWRPIWHQLESVGVAGKLADYLLFGTLKTFDTNKEVVAWSTTKDLKSPKGIKSAGETST